MDDLLPNDVATQNEDSENATVTINEEKIKEKLTVLIPTVSGIQSSKSSSVFTEFTSCEKTLHSIDCRVASMSHHPYLPSNIPTLINNSSDKSTSHRDVMPPVRRPHLNEHRYSTPSSSLGSELFVSSKSLPRVSYQASGQTLPSYGDPRQMNTEKDRRKFEQMHDVEIYGKRSRQEFPNLYSLPTFTHQNHSTGSMQGDINKSNFRRRISSTSQISEHQSVLKTPPPMPPLLKLPNIPAHVSNSAHSIPTYNRELENCPKLPYLTSLHS